MKTTTQSLFLRIFIYLLLAVSFNSVKVKAQTVYIPDYVFANWIYNHSGAASCMVGVQTMDTTCPALLTVTSIACMQYNIADLTGIQYFKNLKSLGAWGCGIAIVPQLPNKITDIDFYMNKITSLPNFPDSLQSINLDNNLLTSLPPIPNGLKFLGCLHNNLSSLPPLPTGMQDLWVGYNPNLTCLPPIIDFDPNGNIIIDSTAIACMPNLITHNGYWEAIDTMQLCSIYNPNGCVLTLGEAPIPTADFQFLIAPNPAKDYFTIKVESSLSKNSLLVVRDLLGREVERIDNIRPGESIDFGFHISCGVYIAEVFQGDLRKVVKVVKNE